MQQPDKSNLPNGSVIQRMTKGGSLSGRLSALATWQTLATIDRWVARYGLWLIVVLAFCYYGQYYRSGLNLGGEGGTVGVLALRLMEGQRPIVDTFLGYNVMWFYPVVWLFQIFGPDYIVLRLFFFAICLLSGLLGFSIVHKATGSGLYAGLVATLIVLMPGMIFRNYMPFLGLLNMFFLLHAYVFSGKTNVRRLFWMAAAGLSLGLTFLIRIELGIFFSVITLGLALLYPIGISGQFRARFPLALAGIGLAFLMVLITHLPVYLDAKARGFDKAFVGQYEVWVDFLRVGLSREIQKEPTPTPSPVLPETSTAVAALEAPNAPKIDDDGLQRLPLKAMWSLPTFYEKTFAAITYLPILVTLLVVIVSGGVFAFALWRGEEVLRESALVVLIAVGCSLTLFPQFFFFRPDTPHLSEFMAPFLVAIGCAVWHGIRMVRNCASLVLRVACALIVTVSVADAGLYTYHTMPKESGGTIAAAGKRTYEFVADNGVRVLLKRREFDDMQGIYKAITENSRPDDFVVCYPYAPTINFMTNRRSYEYNLYVDNATASRKFHENMLKGIDEKRPAIIVIDNRDINQSDSSRFASWAGKTYEHIRETYKHVGKFKRQEIYVRADRFEALQSNQ